MVRIQMRLCSFWQPRKLVPAAAALLDASLVRFQGSLPSLSLDDSLSGLVTYWQVLSSSQYLFPLFSPTSVKSRKIYHCTFQASNLNTDGPMMTSSVT